MRISTIPGAALFLILINPASAQKETTATAATTSTAVLTGQAAQGDWRTDAPGLRRLITVKDLPKPYDTPSVDNGPKTVKRPEGAWPKVPAGFKVEEFATGFKNPRAIKCAPNGDIFVADSRASVVRVVRDADNDGKAEVNEIYADGFNRHFGIEFYPPGPEPKYVYVANTNSVVRIPYTNGDLKARDKAETIVSTLSGGGQLRGGGHWTRDIAFSKDGSKMYVSVGSKSNVSDDEIEARRARIFEYTPDGKNERVYAWGIRNPVGIAVHPETGELWTSVNERDGLGDFLVPDYVTRVKEGGFYGWPWYYIGAIQDPRHEGKKPELKDKVIVPDVLLQSHTASLQMAFYTGQHFPAEYHHDAFAAQHGSWNRKHRTGYKLIQVPIENGKATGEYIDFMTGFVTENGDVWGRPVGVTVAKDGALIVSDDGSNTLWRISHTGK